MSPAVRVRVAHETDVGAVRERNEDSVHVDPRGQFFIVADGMGGHAAGDVASSIAIEVVRGRLDAARDRFDAFIAAREDRAARGLKPLLLSAVRAAHKAIRAHALGEPGTTGMGTTIEVALVLGTRVLVAHVGDSRTYLVRGRRATQLTRDHTMAQLAVAEGSLSPSEADQSKLSSMLTNALGSETEPTVDIIERALRPGDRLLLCTDGLYDGLALEELESTVSVGAPKQVMIELIALARGRGGYDNATGVVVELQGGAAGAFDDEPTVPRPPPRVRTPARGTPTGNIVPANPLAFVPDEFLSGIVDDGIHEETEPVTVVRGLPS
jgi:serine/threonine protein phosphatase PrpC